MKSKIVKMYNVYLIGKFGRRNLSDEIKTVMNFSLKMNGIRFT
jgi:hypothetical protein